MCLSDETIGRVCQCKFKQTSLTIHNKPKKSFLRQNKLQIKHLHIERTPCSKLFVLLNDWVCSRITF